MFKMITGIALGAAMLVPSFGMAQAETASPLSQTTHMLCLPERFASDCSDQAITPGAVTQQALTFDVPLGADIATVTITAFSDNIPQREECASVNGHTVCSDFSTVGPHTVTFNDKIVNGKFIANVRHLAAGEFPVLSECPWDNDRPWLYQPVVMNDQIRACTPGSMHVRVDVVYLLNPPVTTTPPPATTVTPPVGTTIVAPPPTGTTQPCRETPVETRRECEQPVVTTRIIDTPVVPARTLPETGAASVAPLVALGSAAIASGVVLFLTRPRKKS